MSRLHRPTLTSLVLGGAIVAAAAIGGFAQARVEQGFSPARQAAVTQARPQGGQPQAQVPRQPPRLQVPQDPERARQLYVSKNPKDHAPGTNYQGDLEARVKAEERYPELCRGVIDFQKVTYRSSVGDLDVPAYLFQPLQKRGAKGHAAMVWVHGGVHANWGLTMFPFVKEAVERGYVVITPNYRGSTGYGEAFHRAIDYGGYEVDDVVSAVDYLKTLPHVDADRIGIMGWSH